MGRKKGQSGKSASIRGVGRIKVYRGDPLYALTVLRPQSLELVIYCQSIDPGARRGYYSDFWDQLRSIVPPLQVAALLLKPGCWMFVRVVDWAVDETGFWPCRDDLICALLEVDMNFLGPLTWIKPWSNRQSASNESRPHADYGFLRNTENFLAFQKKGVRQIDLEDSELAKAEIQRDFANPWGLLRTDLCFRDANPTEEAEAAGGIAFCEPLLDFLIRMFSFPGDTVYSNIATALRISEKNTRNAIGFGLSGDQCARLGAILSNVDVPKTPPQLPVMWKKAARSALRFLGLIRDPARILDGPPPFHASVRTRKP